MNVGLSAKSNTSCTEKKKIFTLPFRIRMGNMLQLWEEHFFAEE